MCPHMALRHEQGATCLARRRRHRCWWRDSEAHSDPLIAVDMQPELNAPCSTWDGGNGWRHARSFLPSHRRTARLQGRHQPRSLPACSFGCRDRVRLHDAEAGGNKRCSLQQKGPSSVDWPPKSSCSHDLGLEEAGAHQAAVRCRSHCLPVQECGARLRLLLLALPSWVLLQHGAEVWKQIALRPAPEP